MTNIVNCLDKDGLIVINEINVCNTVIITIPIIGVPLLIVLAKILGKYFSTAELLNTSAMVNCQPIKDPKQDIIIKAITILPIVGLNI